MQYSFFQQWSLKSKTAEEELSKVLFYDILINEKEKQQRSEWKLSYLNRTVIEERSGEKYARNGVYD